MRSFVFNFLLASSLTVSLSSALSPISRQLPGRIVGGEPATHGEFPWIVQIQHLWRHHCVGSIFNENWIVTTAQCAQGYARDYTIVAGEHDLSQTDGSEQYFSVTEIKIHPDYDNVTQNADIAVMNLHRSVIIGEYVQRSFLPDPDTIPEGDVIVAGWGALAEEDGTFHDILTKVTVPMVSQEDCRAVYGDASISDSMICAGTGGMGACEGDQGGPLMQNGEFKGVVSWGGGCGRPGIPDVFTSTAHYRHWITSSTP